MFRASLLLIIRRYYSVHTAFGIYTDISRCTVNKTLHLPNINLTSHLRHSLSQAVTLTAVCTVVVKTVLTAGYRNFMFDSVFYEILFHVKESV